MANHTHLPIHKVAYDLLCIITDLARNMPRDVKVLIGSRLRDECVDIVTLIGRANAARHKVPHLDALIEHLQVMELYLRLSRDKKMISTKQYACAVELTSNVGKQAGGWRRSAMSPAA